MRHLILTLAVLLELVGCKGDPRPRAVGQPVPEAAEAAEPAGQRPVALFLAQDDAGKRNLFQLAPDGAEPESVLGFDEVSLAPLAAAAAGGKANAFTVTTSDGKRQLWRGPSLEVVSNAPTGAIAVRAVSDDGSVIVVQDGKNSLIAVGIDKTVDTAGLGMLTYGVALSRDGSKLAFSVMEKSCSSGLGQQATCPVMLYGVDLTGSDSTPRKLAGGDHTVAYDPEFTDPDGTSMLYMTNAGDNSPACRKHVNRCSYEVRSVPFAGGASSTVQRNALLARIAADGSIAYRRNTPPIFFGPGLYVGDKQLLEVGNSIWLHHWSPDSQWLAAVTRRDQETVVEIVDRNGRSHRQPLGVEQARLIGWSAQPLSRGTRTPAEPASIQNLRRAVQRARSEGGPVAIFGVSDLAYARAGGQLDRLQERSRINSWVQQPEALVITERDQYCSERDTAKQPLVAVGRFQAGGSGSGLLLLRRESAASGPSSAGPNLARFAFPDGGAVELMSIDMPASVQWGQRFEVKLRWRVVSALARGAKVFVHFDHVGSRPVRISGDHTPGTCYASDYAPGDVIQDTFEVIATDTLDSTGEPGTYLPHVGWFQTGSGRAKASAKKLLVDNDRVQLAPVEITAVSQK